MRTIYNILLALAVSLAFCGCDDDDRELNKANDVLSLTASTGKVVLDIKSPTGEAVAFQWSSGTNLGTSAAISYIFQLDVAGHGFAYGLDEDMGKNVHTRSLTHQELNQLLLDKLSLPAGEEVTLEARVIASVHDEKVSPQVSPIVTLKVTPYQPVSSTLYITGDATEAGWDNGKALAMNPVGNEAGAFIWNGKLNVGEFKFLTRLGEFLPSYNKDGEEMRLVYRTDFSEPDVKFRVQESGMYKVKVNIIDLTISYEPMEGPRYENLYFVGSFTNWQFVPMQKDPVNSFLFHYNALFEWAPDGEFKIGTQEGVFDNMFHPTIAEAPITHTEVVFNGADNKWKMQEDQCGKAYKLTFDVTEGAESFSMTEFIPYTELWMIGDATAAGWSLGDAVPLKLSADDPYIFTWTGTLKAGELKFTCDKQDDWMGAWFMPAQDGAAPAGELEYITFVDKRIEGNGDVDRKWKIPTAGSYTITLDQLKETIIIKKQ